MTIMQKQHQKNKNTGLVWRRTGEAHGHHDHAGDPEEEDVPARLQQRAREKALQVLAAGRPAEDGEGEEAAGEPGVQHILVLQGGAAKYSWINKLDQLWLLDTALHTCSRCVDRPMGAACDACASLPQCLCSCQRLTHTACRCTRTSSRHASARYRRCPHLLERQLAPGKSTLCLRVRRGFVLRHDPPAAELVLVKKHARSRPRLSRS